MVCGFLEAAAVMPSLKLIPNLCEMVNIWRYFIDSI